ncbi:hypothetical protein LTR53_016119 [Teratosphaeriaceae sp. CCFEE 6253]|nr:hypothetical protein LTR53_016119 [Teratosphaeriaceae sp. CCFEE 6253]
MTTTQPSIEPTRTTTSNAGSLAGPTSHDAITSGLQTSAASSDIPLSPSLRSSTTDVAGASISMSAGLSTSANSSLPPASSTDQVAGMSTSIAWGPAITASPLANSNLSSDDNKSRLHSGFSKSAKEITIATTVIGGVVVLALLLYALRRRRRGATFSEIVRLRPHDPSSITLSPKPQDGRLTALPIHREWRISVHSSRQDCLSPKAAKRPAPVPPAIAQRFHSQNPYVKDLWRTAHPPSVPASPLPGARSHPSVDVVTVKEPEMAHIDPSRLSANSHMSQTSGDWKPGLLSVTERSLSVVEACPPTPPDSPHSQQQLQDRWSWTNSQAPATPRMYAQSLRSSISSMPRFRNIRSWVRGQASRIDEERPALALALEARRPILKNKASLPKLAPPPIQRKLSKSRPSEPRRQSARRPAPTPVWPTSHAP